MDPVTRFIEEPRRRFVDDPAAVATDAESLLGREERAWERAHPEGRVTQPDELNLVLWNFAVGSAVPKPEHRAALEIFLRRNELLIRTGAKITVEGHASRTGAEALNIALSRQRAEAIEFLLYMRGVRAGSVRVLGAGERRPLGGGGSGEALARNRRVEVMIAMSVQTTTEDPNRSTSSLPRAAGMPPRPTEASELFPIESITPRWSGILKARFGPVDLPAPPVGVVKIDGEVRLARIDLGEKPSSTALTTGIVWEKEWNRRIQPAFEAWIGKHFRIKTSSERLAGGVKLGEILVELEAQADPKMPFAVAISPPPLEAATLLFRGFGYQLLQWKFRGTCIPNPAFMRGLAEAGRQLVRRLAPWLLVRIGPAGVAVGVAAAYLGWIAWGLGKLEEARERGQAWGLLASARRGYAQRLACAATDTSEGLCKQNIESLPAGGERVGREVGWEIAGAGWEELSPQEREALKRALGAKRHVPTSVLDRVYRTIGGANRTGSLPHPRELIDLANRR